MQVLQPQGLFIHKPFYTSIHKHCFYTSPAFKQALLLHKSVFTQDLLFHKPWFYTSAVFTQALLLHKTCFYTNAVFTQALSLHKHCLYTRPAFTQKRFYTRPPFTQTLSLHKLCLYTSIAFIQVLLLHNNILLTKAFCNLQTGNRLEGRRNAEGCKYQWFEITGRHCKHFLNATKKEKLVWDSSGMTLSRTEHFCASLIKRKKSPGSALETGNPTRISLKTVRINTVFLTPLRFAARHLALIPAVINFKFKNQNHLCCQATPNPLPSLNNEVKAACMAGTGATAATGAGAKAFFGSSTSETSEASEASLESAPEQGRCEEWLRSPVNQPFIKDFRHNDKVSSRNMEEGSQILPKLGKAQNSETKNQKIHQQKNGMTNGRHIFAAWISRPNDIFLMVNTHP